MLVQPPADFETRARANRRWTLFLAAAFYAFALALCCLTYGTTLGFVVSSPVLGVYFSWWVLNHGGGAGLRWAKWLALRTVDGHHYAFQDVPVGIAWREGQCVVRAADAFQVIDESLDDQVLRRLATRFGDGQFTQDERGDWWFGEMAVLEWLSSRAERLDPVGLKFRLWLLREVFPPLHRKAQGG